MYELITLATENPDFLNNVRDYPAHTLSQFGYTLSSAELDAVFGYLLRNVKLGNEAIINNLKEVEPDEDGKPKPKRW